MDTHFGLGLWMEYQISPGLPRCGCICSAITNGKPNPNRESSSCFAMTRGKRGGGGTSEDLLRPGPFIEENQAALSISAPWNLGRTMQMSSNEDSPFGSLS